MPHRRNTRRMAMQALYQFDVASDDDAALVGEVLAQEGAGPESCAAAIDLATAAWSDHEAADRLAADRAILRLAYHEMSAGRAPFKVVINEAVELAKKFSSDRSPAFINGVLDKMARQLGKKQDPPLTAP